MIVVVYEAIDDDCGVCEGGGEGASHQMFVQVPDRLCHWGNCAGGTSARKCPTSKTQSDKMPHSCSVYGK